jgi:hypothetical protein
MQVSKAYLVGVFPIVFRTRTGLIIPVEAPDSHSAPHVDNHEFSPFVWLNTPHNKLGSNYLRMLE